MSVATGRLVPLPTLVLAAIAMLAFAGNSVLCRLALVDTTIDAASFTVLRIASGAIMLWLLLSVRRRPRPAAGNWTGALALTVYAAAFSLAYLRLDTGTGALLLFGAKRIPEIAKGLGKGITEFKRAVKDVKDEIETSAEETPSTPSQPPPNTTPTSSPEAEKKVES